MNQKSKKSENSLSTIPWNSSLTKNSDNTYYINDYAKPPLKQSSRHLKEALPITTISRLRALLN